MSAEPQSIPSTTGAEAPPILAVSDCISWRLEEFGHALSRIGACLREEDVLSEVQLGYRFRDDLALVVLKLSVLGTAELGLQAVAAAGFPGLRLVEIPADGATPAEISRKFLESCDLVAPVQ